MKLQALLKRALAMVLVVLMVCSVMPLSAVAEEMQGNTTVEGGVTEGGVTEGGTTEGDGVIGDTDGELEEEIEIVGVPVSSVEELEEELARRGLDAQIEFLQSELSKKQGALENANLESSKKTEEAERIGRDALFLDYLKFLRDISSDDSSEKYSKYIQWKNSEKCAQLEALNKKRQMDLIKSDLETLKTRLAELNNPESFICRTFFKGENPEMKKAEMEKILQRQIADLQKDLEENFSN